MEDVLYEAHPRMFRSNPIAFIIFVMIFLLFSLPSAGQRSVGNPNHSTNELFDSIDVHPSKWVGMEFVLLFRDPNLQFFGYDLYRHPEMMGYFGNLDEEFEKIGSKNILYKPYENKTLEVLAVEEEMIGNYEIKFKVKDTGEHLYGKTYMFGFDDIAPVIDKLRATSRWLNTTIYPFDSFLYTYDEGSHSYGKLNIKKLSPCKVIEIWWGTISKGPLWLIVETNEGEQGFIPTAFSYTAVNLKQWNAGMRPWETAFFEKDPRSTFDWPEPMWTLIEDSKVKIGMNENQVLLSWGNPKNINEDIYENETRQQWVYDDQYLYFQNGSLVSIQSN